MQIFYSTIEDALSGKPVSILIISSVLLSLFIIFQWGFIKRKLYDFRLRQAIKKLGKKTLRNVVISDGMDGMIHLEHLVLTPGSILLVYVRRFKGVIFAGDNINLWTQVLDKGSFKFDNPLTRMDEDIVSVNELIPDSRVRGLMVFTDESNFPKGKPERVVSLSDLQKKSCNKSDQVSDKLQEDWDFLMRVIK